MPIYTIVEQRKARGFPLGYELAKQTRKSEDRFHVGDRLSLSIKPFNELRIVEAIPADNPAGVNVTYVVEYMSDVDKQAGGDLVAFPNNYLHLKRNRFY
jgi:hypothetical protein